MPDQGASEIDKLLQSAAEGEASAVDILFDRHRSRLRRMIHVRLDERLLARIDPSDIVQETLMEAHRQLPQYLRERPVEFYPWLRAIALNRLIDLHRRHVGADKRSVKREQNAHALPGSSTVELASKLAGKERSPSDELVQKENRQRIRRSLEKMPQQDQELLALRHLEGLSTREISGVLQISEGAVRSRHFRALERLRHLLDDND